MYVVLPFRTEELCTTFVSAGCAESFLSDIVVHLRPQVNMPDEVIIDIGGIGDRMFFLSSGAIEILIASGRSVRMLQSGDYMGEFALITGERR